MPLVEGRRGVTKKTACKNTKRSREQAKRLSEVNSLQSRLLRLPAELRNRIYEYALVNDDEIELTATSREPPFLHTSRKVRSEALKIYYFGNSFITDIVDCNARLYLRFARRAEALATASEDLRLSPCIVGKPHWSNLVAWCKEVHGGLLWSLESTNGECGQVAEVIAAATTIADQLCGKCSWEECRRVLERMRPLAAFGDAQWNDEEGCGAG